MAEATSGSGTNNLYFIVGGLVVAVVIGVFAYHNGYLGLFGNRTTTEQTVTPNADGSTTTTTTKTTP